MNVANPSRLPAIFASPSGAAKALTVPPRLASWMRKDHPDQVRLDAYLDSLDPLVRPILETDQGPLVLELSVGLPNEQSLLTGGRDLDNFLSPIVHRFGPRRFVGAIGHKVQGTTSTLRVGPARPVDPATVAGWNHAVVSIIANDMTPAWKEELAAALPAGSMVLPDGPVGLQVTLRGSRQKLTSGNWHEYWKPTVDALGQILGEENPARPYHPRDDRITSLGFCRVIEGEGNAIQIDLWWRPAPIVESSLP